MYGELGIQLKNNDFKAFRTKIFVRSVVMLVISVLTVYFVYIHMFKDRFANYMVDFFQNFLHMNYDEAYSLFGQIFRNNRTMLILIFLAIIFLIVFRIYLNWFTKYFEEINKGIDSLMMENTGEISLPSELFPMERKLNTAKYTIEKQKNDILTAEQRKNDLIMYLAHDLKTPLASVIGYLNLLNDEKQISEDLREKYLSISLNKAERLEDLINEFFEISKYNLTEITLQYSRIDLKRMIEMVVYEFQPMFKKKNLDCNMNVPDDIIIKCDADKIQRVFDNLLRNAVIYSYDGTDIDIAVTVQNENIIIKFINHGDTIPKEKLERIFEQFYRLDSSRSTESGGAGLGLAIAKQIIELHGGSVEAESKDDIIEIKVILPAVCKS